MASWSHTANRGGRGKGTSEEMLEQENQLLTENLAGKVNRLKGLAFDIETESKDSNRYIGSMDSDFDSTDGLLTGSLKRMNHMIGGGKNNRKLMCYIIMGLVGLFVISYYIISRFVRR